jgi:RHS repeat-associated protein
VYGEHINVPEYVIKAGVTYRMVSDQLGSVRLVLNVSTGQVAHRVDYDTFGQLIQDTNPGFQPFGFAGGLLDADVGVSRFGARDYDPSSGRWAARDPVLFSSSTSVGGRPGLNLYQYANGDPVNYLDVDGRVPLLAILVAAARAQQLLRLVAALGATVGTIGLLNQIRSVFPAADVGEYCRLAARSLLDRLRQSVGARILAKVLDWANPQPTPPEPEPQEQVEKGPQEKDRATGTG